MHLNKNRFQVVIIAIIIVSLFFSLTNYTNSSENIDNLAYVMAIGIDIGETSKYKISVQFSTVESADTGTSSKSSGGNTSGSDQSSNFLINTVEADSIDKGIAIINSYIDKEINLSHCKIVIVSEELAKSGVSPIINSLINKVEIRPDCNIIVSQISTEEFLDTYSPQMEETIAQYYDVISSTATDNAYTQSISLSDFYYNLKDDLYEPYATLGTVCNPKMNSNTSKDKSLDAQSKSVQTDSDKPLIKTIGLAVFKNDTLVGYLDGIETVCHLLLTNELNNCIINVPSPFSENETVDLYLSNLKDTKIKVRIINGSPYVTVDYDVSLRILSYNNAITALTEDDLKKVENAANNYITEQIYNYFNKTSKELNTDIAGIGRFALNNFKTISEWDSYNWLENYKNCTFKVNAKMSIKSGYLLSNE